MRIDEKIEKYLKEEKVMKYEVEYPPLITDLVNSINIKTTEIIIRSSDFISFKEKNQSEKMAKKWVRKISNGAKLTKIVNDKIVIRVDNMKSPDKISKLYDNLEEFEGGFTNVEMILFIYSPDKISKDDQYDMQIRKVAMSFTG